MALSDTRIRNAKGRATRYRLSDSHGLSIEVTPAGNKFWRYRYRIDGKENLFAAGEWCIAPAGEKPHQAEARQAGGRMTLAEARAARLEWRDQVKSGQHPRLVRAAVRLLASQSAANTFKAVAQEFVERRGAGWGTSHRRSFTRFLENDCYPDLGRLPIATIGPGHVLAVLQKIEARGSYSVARLGRGHLGQVFRYAVASHKATLDPTWALAGALTKTETRHHPPLARDEIGRFLMAVAKAGADRQTEIAVRLLLLTMLRTVELRTGRWAEIDLAHAEWRLPAEKMKMRRPHTVPLPRQTVDLLIELQKMTGNGWFLFPNQRDPKRCMAASTLAAVFQRAGYTGRFTPHGSRSTASTLLREAGFDDRLIELQLAHVDKNKSRASYDHAELLEPRRKMLQAWGDMISSAEHVSIKVKA